MKKLIALALVLTMLLTLAACDLGLSKKDLAHRWSMLECLDADVAAEYLDYFGFEEAEVALADLNSIGAIRYLTFTEDGHYSYEYDAEATEKHMYEYFDKLIETVYEHLDELTDVYGEGVKDEFTLEEFKDYYAYIFDFDTYDELLKAMAADTFTEEDYEGGTESGTYKLSGKKVIMFENGLGDGASVDVVLENNTITVTYADGVEVYTLAD